MAQPAFDPLAGKAGKQAGMAQAQKHADPHWWQCMLECGRAVALRKQWFFTDDIVRLCMQAHPNVSTHEHRAIGPLMRQMARLGYCEPTQDWIQSAQKQNHRRPMMVWWSLIYRGPPMRAKPRRRPPLDPRQLQLVLLRDMELVD